MSNIRLYTRSIYKTIINQWKIFINIKNSVKDVFQIVGNKEKMYRNVSLTREKFERRREIINSENSYSQNNVINFIR